VTGAAVRSTTLHFHIEGLTAMPKKRILVVDDNAAVLRVAERVLAWHGFEVFPASTPRQALEMASHGLGIDLILSDVSMPGMSGPELIGEIRRHSPSIPAVLMSGYAAVRLPRDIPLVQKPFTASQLLSTINQVLQNKASSGGHSM